MSSTIKVTEPEEYDTGVELSLLEKSIQSATGSKSVIKSWTASKMAEVRGAVSHIVIVKLEWSPEDAKLPPSVAFKLPTTQTLEALTKRVKLTDNEEEEVWDIEKLINLAQTAECAFFNFARGKKWNVRHTKSYCGSVQKPAVLIFEDLSGDHFSDFFVDTLTLNRCLQITESLAALHAYCIQNDDWKTYPELNSAGRELVALAYDGLLKRAPRIAAAAKKNFPQHFDPIADRVPELGLSLADLAYIDTLNDEFNLPPVIVHGDLHIQNMSFDRQDPEKVSAIFDWQMVHTGSVVEDLGRMLCMSTEPELRRTQTQAILEHYYKALQKELQPKPVPFTLETLRKALDKATRYSTALNINMFRTFSTLDDVDDAMLQKWQKILHRTQCMLVDCFALIDAGKA